MLGTCTLSGSISPFSTISSTSAIQNFVAAAKSIAKEPEFFLKIRFPLLSLFHALIIPKSALKAVSSK